MSGFLVADADLPRIRAILTGEVPPATPRPAATVAVVRDGERGLEVYLMRRVRQMAFAAGMHVFPGGSVSAADADPGIPRHGPDPAWWAARFGIDEESARSAVTAAARETFEECGVLLADGDGAVDEADRAAVENGEAAFVDVLRRASRTLRTDLLRPLAHWLTPELEPRRYDTYFFLAALPAGQQCREAGTEADTRLWLRPAEVAERGLAVMAPTAAVLADLARHPDVASAMAADRKLPLVMPRLRLEDGRLHVEVPPR